ncbi:MAG: cation:proton antiporter [Syntrophobacterales bacterium]|nr:cation:proton antiporter [Syntrophobacterales bacterium]
MSSKVMLPPALLAAAGLCLLLLTPQPAQAAEAGHTLLASISISILVATLVGCLAVLLKQPLLLAYIVGGVIIGPQMGFAWVRNKSDIETIAEIGLILLLFMIGLELDLKKIRESGKSLILTGVLQFVLCVSLAFGFLLLLGFSLQAAGGEYSILGVPLRGGPYDLLYLAACLGLSSTTIVVKLLYEKFELDTLAGRLTVGVLIFQDLWAIVLLGLQPNLSQPQVGIILWSFAKGGFLVVVSLVLSKYGLGFVFQRIAKLPELVLVASLGWCFFMAGLANYLGLSMEMGALIAGVAISTFPYNLDIIGKIINIRDFFITLFFVALGMVIPNPLSKPGLFAMALLLAGFLVLTRFLTVFPLLYWLGNGNRVSLLTSINLSQLSEFALVIAVLGAKPDYGHIGSDTLTLIIFIFVVTSIASTYMIKSSHALQTVLSRGAERLGFRPLREERREEPAGEHKEVAVLGFFRVASALVAHLEQIRPELLQHLVVVDFNPEVYRGLRARGVKVVYGDISNLQTLHHAGLEHARLILSTITDDILVGTDNLKIINAVRPLAPQAKILVSAHSASQALKLYQAGADYVLLPHEAAALRLEAVLDQMLQGEADRLRETEMARLARLTEILT